MSKQSSSGGMNSLLGVGSRYEGTGHVEGTLRVDGLYQGGLDIDEVLVIGKTGEFVGDIRARDVVVSGRLRGTVQATGTVEFQRGCHFEGEVRTRTLVVEEGVFFQGNCRMDDGAGSTAELAAAERGSAAESRTLLDALPSPAPVAVSGAETPSPNGDPRR